MNPTVEQRINFAKNYDPLGPEFFAAMAKEHQENPLGYRPDPELEKPIDQYLMEADLKLEEIIKQNNHPLFERYLLKKLNHQVGLNLFHRSYYSMPDSTSYLNTWKYWAANHRLNAKFDHLWDHVFI